MSLNALVRLPLSSSGTRRTQLDDALLGHSSAGVRRPVRQQQQQQQQRTGRRQGLVVEAKGKKAVPRQLQRQAPPPLPKIEDDGNPRFVIFIRTANVGGTFFSLKLLPLLLLPPGYLFKFQVDCIFLLLVCFIIAIDMLMLYWVNLCDQYECPSVYLWDYVCDGLAFRLCDLNRWLL